MRTKSECIKEYERWIKEAETELTDELKKLSEDQIIERFYDDLEFGTGGMRGKLGAGTNRMNVHTIAKATQGFANWLNENYSEPSVAIAYDTRNMSREFADKASEILSGNNIEVHLFGEPMPTPVLSYAVRELNCDGGIVITASHNPPEYNGYKIYTHDGTQAVPFFADQIIDKVNNCDFFSTVQKNSELINLIEEDLLKNFESRIVNEIEKLGKPEKTIKTIYTPIHGTGKKPVMDVLKALGHTVIGVEEQLVQDGNFPTVSYPNPEDPAVFAIGLELAKKEAVDLIIATDPDCDRMGVMVKHKDKYQLLNGNQIGVIFTSFILERLKDNLPEKPYVVKTIVSTDMVKEIAREYGVEVKETLTGFKFIGEIIEKSIENRDGNFIFGFEESYGCLFGTHARDKDAVVASALLTTVAAFLNEEGMTLVDYLESLFERYGYYVEELLNFGFEGIEGMGKISTIMENMRKNPPKKADNISLSSIKDYKSGINDLPPSNVIILEYGEEMKLIGRPSGTEPKIKFYLLVKGKEDKNAREKIELLKKLAERIISQ